jgi:hypothetical protein
MAHPLYIHYISSETSMKLWLRGFSFQNMLLLFWYVTNSQCFYVTVFSVSDVLEFHLWNYLWGAVGCLSGRHLYIRLTYICTCFRHLLKQNDINYSFNSVLPIDVTAFTLSLFSEPRTIILMTVLCVPSIRQHWQTGRNNKTTRCVFSLKQNKRPESDYYKKRIEKY